jgi:hypothetical protein
MDININMEVKVMDKELINELYLWQQQASDKVNI